MPEPVKLETGQRDGRELTDRSWDVAVVGAGPAGSIAALHLARQGHKVLVLDKEEFPREQVCGDALIADAVRTLERMGCNDEVQSRGQDVGCAVVFSPSRIAFQVSGHFITLKRRILDAILARRAVDAGASFFRAAVSECTTEANGSCTVSLRQLGIHVRAKAIIVATGADIRLVRDALVDDPLPPSAVAMRCYVKSSYAIDEMLISYDRSILPGYAWIFPLGKGEYNVGCGYFYRGGTRHTPNLLRMFEVFCQQFPPAARLIKGASVHTPMKGATLRCGLGELSAGPAGNVVAVGETIGATFPFTGEGIGKAMETGELAAKLLDRCLLRGDFSELQLYPSLVTSVLGDKYLGYRVAQRWLSHAWLADLLAKRMKTSPFLRDAASGMLNETIDPRDIFSLHGILRSFLE